MDYLQYLYIVLKLWETVCGSFKPCYKWITFNTKKLGKGLQKYTDSFKPCYKWITFNTNKSDTEAMIHEEVVLNLVINGLPSIHRHDYAFALVNDAYVLNLVINGLPSILTLFNL